MSSNRRRKRTAAAWAATLLCSIPFAAEREGGGAAVGFFPSGHAGLGAPAAIAAEVTDFSGIPAGVNTTYQSMAAGFATPTVLTQANIAGTGRDVGAQAGNNGATFVIRGIGTAGNGDGGATLLLAQVGVDVGLTVPGGAAIAAGGAAERLVQAIVGHGLKAAQWDFSY